MNAVFLHVQYFYVCVFCLPCFANITDVFALIENNPTDCQYGPFRFQSKKINLPPMKLLCYLFSQYKNGTVCYLYKQRTWIIKRMAYDFRFMAGFYSNM